MSALPLASKNVRESDSSNLETLFLRVLESDILERIELPRRPEKLACIPATYRYCRASAAILKPIGAAESLWSHQSAALDKIDAGENVLLTTGTGSGKTLVFQLPLLRMLNNDGGTGLVLYPQKALCSDQLARWYEALDRANLPRHLVCVITGNTPMQEREQLLKKARLVLATPDVCHAWLARNQSELTVSRYLSALRFLVIDEAHALEGVFGSNAAYLIRRLILASDRASGAKNESLQLIAASATIADPAEHLELLTGRKFEVISEDMNGAPRAGMVLFHVEGPDRGSAAETYLSTLLTKLDDGSHTATQVAFVDSRQGVERITKEIDDDAILPYRNGFEDVDRGKIEKALRNGGLKACVSTSAMELGIDVASFRVGFNLGLPPSRKSLKQRVGRVGRAAPGIFAVIAPANAFKKLGMTLEDFADASVEPSHLYLENEVIQYQQAACLLHECADGDFDLTNWPSGFEQMVELIKSNSRLPQSVRRIAESNGGIPHFDFSLRQIATAELSLVLAQDTSHRIGKISHDKALREAYPGAVYLHARKAYRVSKWRLSSFERSVLLEPIKSTYRTFPLLTSRVQVPVSQDTWLNTGILTGSRGSLIEQRLRVNEAVHGYAIGSRQFTYRSLAEKWPSMRSKYREFDTTGVVIRIDEEWFAGSGEVQTARRKRIAKALRAALLAHEGILPSEIGFAHSGIAIRSNGGSVVTDDALVIFDDMQGGLRLTTPLFDQFEFLLERLRLGADLAGEDAYLDSGTLDRLSAWRNSLDHGEHLGSTGEPVKIYAPGSVLGHFIHGEMIERCIYGHQLLMIDGREQLMYSYKFENGFGWAKPDSLKPIGDDWSYLSEKDLQAQKAQPC